MAVVFINESTNMSPEDLDRANLALALVDFKKNKITINELLDTINKSKKGFVQQGLRAYLDYANEHIVKKQKIDPVELRDMTLLAIRIMGDKAE